MRFIIFTQRPCSFVVSCNRCNKAKMEAEQMACVLGGAIDLNVYTEAECEAGGGNWEDNSTIDRKCTSCTCTVETIALSSYVSPTKEPTAATKNPTGAPTAATKAPTAATSYVVVYHPA